MDPLKAKLKPMYRFLVDEPGPRMIKQALPFVGLREYPGGADNPEIIKWAHYVDKRGYSWISDMFERGGDSVAWCGLFVGMLAKRSGKTMPNNPLSALAWADWGRQVARQVYARDGRPTGKIHGTPMLGDVLVFTRGRGKGHVGLYVGEDPLYFHVLGGNQSDSVSIARIKKTRFYSAQRLYRNQPKNVRPIHLAAVGKVSEREA